MVLSFSADFPEHLFALSAARPGGLGAPVNRGQPEDGNQPPAWHPFPETPRKAAAGQPTSSPRSLG